jgi:hypothetical protein
MIIMAPASGGGFCCEAMHNMYNGRSEPPAEEIEVIGIVMI